MRIKDLPITTSVGLSDYLVIDTGTPVATKKITLANLLISGGVSGSVTSVALSLPNIFTVSGSPVTTAGTLTGTLASQAANTVFVAPNGSSGTPTFRALVVADIPTLSYAPLTSGNSILYGNGAGGFSSVTIGSGLSFATGTLSSTVAGMVYPGSGIPNSTGSAWGTSYGVSGTTSSVMLTDGALSGGSVNNSPIGASTASTGKFTTLQADNIAAGGTPSTIAKLYSTGTGSGVTTTYGVRDDQAIQSPTSTHRSYFAFPSTQATAFTVASYEAFHANLGALGAGSTITAAIGFYAAANLGNAGTAYGVQSLIASGTNKWNIYSSGTANNAFAGNVRIGSTVAPTVALDVTGAINTSGAVTSSNGTISSVLSYASNGLVGTISNHSFSIYTNNASVATFDTSGNLGLGVTPSAWSASFSAIDLKNSGALWAVSPGSVYLTSNAYNNGTNYIYKSTAAASQYQQSGGAHYWYTATSGTAGATFTFTQRMQLDSTGLAVTGVSSASGFQSTSNSVNSTGSGVEILGGASGVVQAYNRTGGAYINMVVDGLSVALRSSGTTRAFVDSTGLAVTGQISASGRADFTLASTGRVGTFAGSGDRLRVFVNAASSGATIDVTDSGETTTARPLNIGGSNGTINLGGTTAVVSSTGVAVTGAVSTTGQITTSNVAGSTIFEASTATTNAKPIRIANTGGNAYFGVESSAGGSFLTGAAAYSFVINNVANTPIHFATNNTLQATLDTSGNLGLGVAPSSYSTIKTLQVGESTFIGGDGISVDWSAIFANNAAPTGGNTFKYANVQPPTAYRQYNGTHLWYTAPSGTAGTAITFTQAMTLDASGNLLVGATSGAAGSGAYATFGNSSAGTPAKWAAFFGTNTAGAAAAPNFGLSIGWNISNGGGESNIVYGTGVGSNPAIAFSSSDGTTVTERMRLDTSGNLGLGVTPSAWSNGKAFQFGTNSALAGIGTETDLTMNAYYNSGWKYLTSSAATYYSQSNGTHYWYNAPSGTAGNAITFTTAMTLDAGGNLGLGVTPSAWSGQSALQVGTDGSFSGRANTADMMMNAYFDGANYKYVRSFYASQYQQQDGNHRWYTAPSGTAGNAITFTQAMTLDASGKLTVTGGVDKLTTASGVVSVAAATAPTTGQVLTATSATTATWQTPSSGGGMVYPGAGIANSTGSAWGTSYTASGSGTVVALATGATLSSVVSIGVGSSVGGWSTTNIHPIQLAGNGSAPGSLAQVNATTTLSQNAYHDGTSWKYLVGTFTPAQQLFMDQTGIYLYTGSGASAAGTAISWIQSLKVTSSAITLATSGGAINNVTLLDSKPVGGLNNHIINGQFSYSQLNGNTAMGVTTLSQYLIDRWAAISSTASAGTLTAQRVAYAASSFMPYMYRLTRGSGTWAGVAKLCQPIESLFSVDLVNKQVVVGLQCICGSGYLGGDVTVSVLTSTGTDQTAAQFFAGTATGQATANSLTFTPSVAGGARTFTATIGTSVTQVALLITTGTYSGTGTANDWIQFGNISLSPGSVVNTLIYEWRPPSVELQLCQRYCTIMTSWMGAANSTTNSACHYALPVTMRTTPAPSVLTAVASQPGNLSLNSIVNVGGTRDLNFDATVSVGMTVGFAYRWAGQVAWLAEL